jgi:hypothetical protein
LKESFDIGKRESDKRINLLLLFGGCMEVKIPKEIKAYKERFILNLTLRQTISFILGIFVVVPIFLLGTFKYQWNQEIVSWMAILLGVPVFGIGFFSYNEMSIEKFLFQFFKVNFVFPVTRKYKSSGVMGELTGYDEFYDEKEENRKSKGKKEQISDTENSTGYDTG